METRAPTSIVPAAHARAHAPTMTTRLRSLILAALAFSLAASPVAAYGVIHRYDHVDDETHAKHVRAMYRLDDLLSEYNRLHDHHDPDHHRRHREPEYVRAYKEKHLHAAQHARRVEALRHAHGDGDPTHVACDDPLFVQSHMLDCLRHPTWEHPHGACCEGLRMWNDAGCNCDDVRNVLTHDATFEHYARVAAKFSPQCDVTPRTHCGKTQKTARAYGVVVRRDRDRSASSGHFHLALPARNDDAIGARTPGATLPELELPRGLEPGATLPELPRGRSLKSAWEFPELPRGRSLKSAWESTAGKQTIDCALLQSAMLALLPCLGQVAETVSDECCKGLKSWNDAGCYCDGVQTIMDDPETPKAYVELAAVLTPACQVEKVTDSTHRVCAPPPPAPPPDPPPPNPPPRPPASSTLAFATTSARETWGAFYRSFSPYEWDAPTDEDYCKWMADVLVCDYIKNQDDCEWKDSEAGGEKEVLTPCEWYEGKCELRDYLQIGARELRNAFRNVLAASQSAHDACAAGCDGDDGNKDDSEKCVETPHGCLPSVDAAMAAADAASSEIRTTPVQRMVYRQYMHGVVRCNAGKGAESFVDDDAGECAKRDGCSWDPSSGGGAGRCEPTRAWREATSLEICTPPTPPAPPPPPPRPPVAGYEYNRTRGDGFEKDFPPWAVWTFMVVSSAISLSWMCGCILVYKRHPECPKPDSSESEADSDENGDDSSDGEVTHSEITVETSELVKSDDEPVLRGRRGGSRRGEVAREVVIPPWPKYAPVPYARRKSTAKKHRKPGSMEQWERMRAQKHG